MEIRPNISVGASPQGLPNLAELGFGIWGLLGLLAAYAIWKYLLPKVKLGMKLNAVISKGLDFYLTRQYPIHHLETGKPLPGRPFQWPNGQGDVDKFMGGIENRDKWAQEHGQIYRVWAGMKPEIVLQKPEHVKLVFRDSDRHSKAVNNDSGYLMGEVLGKCLGLISGAEWRTLRAVSEPAFRHSTAIDYLSLIHRRVGSYLEECTSMRAGLVDPVQDFKFLPFFIIGDILYGEMTSQMEEGLREMAPIRERLFQLVISGGIARFSWSQNLPTEAGRVLKQFQSRWIAFNQTAYRRARELEAFDTPVYQLFAAVERGEITAENAYQTLDEMLFANLDVTMGALSWNPVFLAAHSDVQDALYESISQAKEEEGTKLAGYLQSSSTYLAACIQESARLKPLAAFSVPQAAPSERILDGYLVPAGTSFIVDAYALNVEHPFWGADRRDYRPSRFLQLNASETRYHLWRFGFGPRQCLGKYVADLIVRVFLAHLVQNWKLEFEKGEGTDSRDWQRDVQTWITHPKVKLIVKPR
ncbi:cytochrome P450 [Aspergillus carlsbadensis]|nr:cytochrome P450 [Aspergillus carlsbadensis]